MGIANYVRDLYTNSVSSGWVSNTIHYESNSSLVSKQDTFLGMGWGYSVCIYICIVYIIHMELFWLHHKVEVNILSNYCFYESCTKLLFSPKISGQKGKRTKVRVVCGKGLETILDSPRYLNLKLKFLERVLWQRKAFPKIVI